MVRLAILADTAGGYPPIIVVSAGRNNGSWDTVTIFKGSPRHWDVTSSVRGYSLDRCFIVHQLLDFVRGTTDFPINYDRDAQQPSPCDG